MDVFHVKELQFKAKPDRPNPIFANRLQEVLGGQFGEMTVMMQYLFQGFSCKGPAKYKDMLLDIGTEEIAHVEMLCSMIAHLLEGAPVSAQEQMVASNPMLAAIMGGTNPQHLIVAGAGPMPVNSVGVPWSGAYMVASGDLMADFHANLNGEIQGRLQVARLYNMTDDTGVRDMLAFMIARDTMHQNQWLAAIEELKADGLGSYPVPNTFPMQREDTRVSYQFWNMSQGAESQAGRWAHGRTPDGKGSFEYLTNPTPMGPAPEPAKPHNELHNTGGAPTQVK